jgi:hypothetical protein
MAYGVLMLLVHQQASLFVAAEWLLCALAGSLFPDVDIKSKGQKYFYYCALLLLSVLLLYQKYELFACCSMLAFTPMLARHRGIFHELWFVIAAPLGVWFVVSGLYPSYAHSFFFDTIFFIAGAISHLWLDRGFFRMMRRNGGYKRRL